MTAMTNVEKLTKLLEDMGTTNFHVDWGPEAHLLTAEERAGIIYRAITDPNKEIVNIDRDFPKIRYDAPVNVREYVEKLK